MLPDLLIIGAEKGGTTWLHDVLRRHPALFLPDVKEVHYFNRFDSNLHDINNFVRRDQAWYEQHFKAAEAGQLVGEATPMYLCDPEAPRRIRETLPDARFVVVLRNPVTRAWSHFRMATAKAHVAEDFATLIAAEDDRILRRGLYARQLESWFSLFPREQFHILFFEEVTTDPAAALSGLARWLGIDAAPLLDEDLTRRRNEATNYRSAWIYNASVRGARALRSFPPSRRLAAAMKASGLYDRLKAVNRVATPSPALAMDDRNALVAYYRQDVVQLRNLLERSALPWPEFTSPSAVAP
ncbi:MAG: sulfotransferase [Paracoccaceae bacterium]